MRGLPKAPVNNDFHPRRLTELFGSINEPTVQKFLSDANRHYYHWEELRRRPQPLAWKPEETWMVLKLTRSAGRPLPLEDQHGSPFHYWLPDHLQQVLHAVDRLGGGALAVDRSLADGFADIKDRVLIDSLMEEAIASSQIEGASTTRSIAKDMLRSGREPKNRSELMIVNGYRTMRMLIQRKGENLTLQYLHEIQTSMTQGILDSPDQAGRLRTYDDNVHVVDERDNEVVYTPPDARHLSARLEKLVDFANLPINSEPFIHPLVKASILHFWLAYEHPYVDGNGRTARALFYWSMLRHGYWLFEFLTISRIIHAAPMRYYRAFLYTETDDNDLTYFISFLLEVTRRSLDQLHERVREMHAEQRRIRALDTPAVRKLNPRQRALLHHALLHPAQVYTFQSHQNSHAINNQTARTDILKLVKLGFLIEVGAGRPREFMAAKDIDRKAGLVPRR